VSSYVPVNEPSDRLAALLSLVWKHAPRVKSDSMRYHAVEVAQAAIMGLITTWRGEEWGHDWLITTKGLKLLTGKMQMAPRVQRKK
jgi:hypothetical protein